MLVRFKSSGFSLIELMIGLAVLSILVMAGVPSLKGWIQSAQIRTAAESLQNGLQLARTEAVRRNALVRFQLVSDISTSCSLSISTTSWVVSLDEPTGKCGLAASDTVTPRIVETRSGKDGTPNVIAAVTPEQYSVFFDGLGRQVSSLVTGTTPSPNPSVLVTYKLSNPTGGACVLDGGKIRCLNITVTPGGKIRLCDPTFDGTANPQGCV